MKFNHRSLRLKDYNYTQPGPYFVTTVTHGRECLFGNVVDGEMQLSDTGQIVADTWQWLGSQYPYLELGAAVGMPNHFHGIILIGDPSRRGGSRPAPTKIKPLGQLVGTFKTVSAKRINLLHGTPGLPVWQRDFYERVIRDQNELERIHQTIRDNPANWQEDAEYAKSAA
jgi:putative transposase